MTNYDMLLQQMWKQGMDKKWARMFVKKLADDEMAFQTTEEQKKWAMERGFFPGRVELYGLNEENYRDYIPDFSYFMIHPMNHHFRIWVNDKLSLKYVLSGSCCEDVMPAYYLYVENDGTYTYLMDCPQDIPKDRDFLWNLLCKEKILAMKPNSGTSGGLGFIKLELRDEGLIENNKPIDKTRFEQIRDSMRNYIVTEYAGQHPDLAKVWPDSECTLRVIMCKDVQEDFSAPASWSCAVSYARFGTSVNGGASNLSSGGVGVGFDFETGKYNDICVRYKKYCPDGQWHLMEHPDTKMMWAELGLPNWEFVKCRINQICSHISSLSYLGLDIIITPQGMKLCEINTHPAMDYEQVMCGPTLRKEKVKEFFAGKGLFDVNTADFYAAYLESQE